ncbi:MAG TPA: retropepsin-like aspartic protease [Chryseosolibacter sp.]
MKRPVCILILLLALGCSKKNKNESVVADPVIENRLQKLIDAGEYFRLRADLAKYREKISSARWLYFRAFTYSAFNDYPESTLAIDSLLNDQRAPLQDSTRVNLMLLLRDNYFKTFQYEKAASVGQELLGRYKETLGDRLHDVENEHIIHQALAGVLPQQTALRKVTLKWKPNEIGLIEIPVKSGSTDLQIVFDTRADISTATQSFAKKLRLRLLDVSYELGSGLTGKTFQSSLGIADSLYIGDILVQHVVFQVVPDEILSFPSINVTLHGILGFPVITQLREIHIFQNGDFIISPGETTSDLRNLAFDGLTPVLSVASNNDTLSFYFDTGASGSDFYDSFFNRYRASVLEKAKLKTVETGGAGGIVKNEVYSMPVVDLTIGRKNLQLKDVSIRTKPIYKGQKYYGNLGQDVIRQFDEMILDFESMYIDFR